MQDAGDKNRQGAYRGREDPSSEEARPVAELTPLPAGYPALLEELKTRIRAAQLRAALTLNQETIRLYWSIGQDLCSRFAAEGWGTTSWSGGSSSIFVIFCWSWAGASPSWEARCSSTSTTSSFYVDLLFYHLRLHCYFVIDLLCGRPHNSSSVALPIMWRSAKQAAIFAPFQVFERHIIGARRRRRMPIRLFG